MTKRIYFKYEGMYLIYIQLIIAILDNKNNIDNKIVEDIMINSNL